mmetsp:Transcript_40863/g.127305  ORF Transcript_40863/g.127305 Transcript_40863/m.127305 type:complete len:268 (-) Transcript_40863:9-812(-)
MCASVMSRPLMPGVQITFRMPMVRWSSASTSALVRPTGLRLAFRMQDSVAIAVPAPSTSKPPPSSTSVDATNGTPLRLATSSATRASLACACFPPQPLKLKLTHCRGHCVVSLPCMLAQFEWELHPEYEYTQLVSRIHRSSTWNSCSDTLRCVASKPARCMSLGETKTVTGSYSAMVLAMSMMERCTSGSSFVPQTSVRVGRAIHVRVWGSSSMGMYAAPWTSADDVSRARAKRPVCIVVRAEMPTAEERGDRDWCSSSRRLKKRMA